MVDLPPGSKGVLVVLGFVARHKKSARHRLAIFSVVILIGSLESPPSN
jgi:hypothetical protein